jgi:hypothetical protein
MIAGFSIAAMAKDVPTISARPSSTDLRDAPLSVIRSNERSRLIAPVRHRGRLQRDAIPIESPVMPGNRSKMLKSRHDQGNYFCAASQHTRRL